jgi:predicted nuclease with RNAse H fold
MTSLNTTIGIDVGGIKKGFHAVANRTGKYLAQFHSSNADEIAAWVLDHQPSVIAIDAPSMFSLQGNSRQAERDLVKNGMRCFYTPTRELAAKSRFYDWVFNGERLYQALGLPIFSGEQNDAPCMIETFPHGIQISLWGNDHQYCPEGGKLSVRKNTLVEKSHYDTSQLSCIDFVDAALCAVTADYFFNRQFTSYGCITDGFILMPLVL